MSEVESGGQQPAERPPLTGRTIRLLTLSTVMSASALPEIISKSGEMTGTIERDVLPEPWDAPDHVGNFWEGGLYTVFSFSLLANLMTKGASAEDYPSKIRKAAVGAFAVSSAIQLAGEKFGDTIGITTGDVTDSAYGIVFSALAAVLCNIGYQKAFQADEKRWQHYEGQAQTADQSTQGEVKAGGKPNVKRMSPQNRKNNRKQQRASRKKNR